MNGILLGQDQDVAKWAYQHFNLYPLPVNRALGILNSKGELVGAALFQNYNGSNIELSYYGPGTVSLGIIRTLARVAVAFNVSRATLITSKRNRRLMKSLVKLGFKIEGVQRRFYGHSDAARNTGVRFVMFREGIDSLAAANRQPEKGAA